MITIHQCRETCKQYIRPQKKTALIAVLISLPVYFFLVYHHGAFYDTENQLWQNAWFFYALLLPFLSVCILSLSFTGLPQTWKTIGRVLSFFLFPILSIQMVECFDTICIYDYSVQTFLANYSVYMALYLLFFILSGSTRFSLLFFTGILFVFALANHLVTYFRGNPVVPMDLFSVVTAFNVSGNYDFHLSSGMITGFLTWILLLICFFKVKSLRLSAKRFLYLARAGCLLPLGIFLFVFYKTDTLTDLGYKPDFWNQSRGYQSTGSFFNFCLNSKYLFTSEPEGYEADQTEPLISSLIPEGEEAPLILKNLAGALPDGQKPNIICIMNESFSDLRVIGDFETNRNYMPFIDSLTKNTIKGNLYVPVKGAGTSNSEFEFLTGANCAFLPAGSNAYELYIKDKMNTLVSTLEKQGYSSLAFHPYYADGWKRDQVYPFFGFDEFISIESLIDQDILDDYRESNDSDAFTAALDQRYPGKNMLLRRFVSDSYNYKVIEEYFEKRDKTKPFFCFNVTMQNHGGYTRSYQNFNQQVYVKNMDLYPEMANRYLSLVKDSDTAFKELVHYFQNVSEPTIICMFGDHQPYLETSFFEKLFGKDLDRLTEEEDQKQYITPFVIWANYDIGSGTIEQMSANYLSTLLLQTAGLELPDFNRYLAALYQKLPVVNTTEYIGKDGNYYNYESNSPYRNLLSDYEKIQYNYLFDKKNRKENLY